jgi:hypothetical protein
MPFTNEERQKIEASMQARIGPTMRCFTCGVTAWAVPDDAGLLVFYETHTGRINYMNGIPVLPFICQNCGHTIFFSTNVLELEVEAPPEAAEVAVAAAEEAAAGKGSAKRPRKRSGSSARAKKSS